MDFKSLELQSAARTRLDASIDVATRRTLPLHFLRYFTSFRTSSCRRRAPACPGRKVASVLLALWSPKGGSGTSVFAAACALVLAREIGSAGGVRIADLDGDQPAIFGLGADPELGLLDWLGAGPEAPTEALDRLLVEVAPGVGLLPRGGTARETRARTARTGFPTRRSRPPG